MTKTEFVKTLGFDMRTSNEMLGEICENGPAAESNGVVIAMAAAGQSCYFAVLWNEHVIYFEDYCAQSGSVSVDATLGGTNSQIIADAVKINTLMNVAIERNPTAQVQFTGLVYDEKLDKVVERPDLDFYATEEIQWLVSDEAKRIYEDMIAAYNAKVTVLKENEGCSLNQMAEWAHKDIERYFAESK